MSRKQMLSAISAILAQGFAATGIAEENQTEPSQIQAAETKEPAGDQNEKPDDATPVPTKAAQPKVTGDAADPTDVTSAVNVNLEWQRNEHAHGRTQRYGLRLSPKLGVSKSVMIMLEMPFMYADNSGTKNDAAGQGKADDLFGIGGMCGRVSSICPIKNADSVSWPSAHRWMCSRRAERPSTISAPRAG